MRQVRKDPVATQATADTIAWRYVTGRPLDGRTGYPYLSRGLGRWAGWQRQAARLGIPAAGVTAIVYPREAAAVGGALVARGAWRLRHRWALGRFRREYVAPSIRAMDIACGGAPVTLRVDEGLGSLVARLAKPQSPAEIRFRHWYGEHLEPVVRWLPDRAMRVWWVATRAGAPVGRVLEQVRRPQPEDVGPRISLTVATPYLTAEQRQLVSAIVNAKIPVSDMVETWDQIGSKVTAQWVVRKRPPAMVGIDALMAHGANLSEWEFYLGQGAGDKAVTLSLRDDSPHIAVSAGTGAGKSILAQLLAVQVLARGGQVVILDRKGSHRWALGLDGVDYCSRPAQMHAALVRLAQLADERNTLAMHEDDDWIPGPRILIICEELNATIGQLAAYWAEIRTGGDPKRSPAISGLADILYMGRSALVNVVAVAQMLTARAIGGPEARENFGVRCLARYSRNAWQMLVPEAAMPRPTRTLGRWQVVIGGQATETQVCYLTRGQARTYACTRTHVPVSPAGLDSALTSYVPVDRDMVTLREASDHGVIPWGYEAAKKRIQRSTTAPKPRDRRGSSDLYDRGELAQWALATTTTSKGDETK